MNKLCLSLAIFVAIALSGLTGAQAQNAQEERLRVLEVAEAVRAAEQAKEALERDKADLQAQEGMEIAAKRMADFTLWQVVIGALGAIVVTGTLYQSLRSIRHSADAVKQNAGLIELTKQNAELQLKAYPTRVDAKISGFDEHPKGEIVYKNFGQTPCVYCDINVEVDYYEGRFQDAPWKDITDHLENDKISLAPGDQATVFGYLPRALTPAEITKITAYDAALIMRAEAIWKDVFGNVYRRRHVWHFSGENADDRGVVIRAGSEVLLRREDA